MPLSIFIEQLSENNNLLLLLHQPDFNSLIRELAQKAVLGGADLISQLVSHVFAPLVEIGLLWETLVVVELVADLFDQLAEVVILGLGATLFLLQVGRQFI